MTPYSQGLSGIGDGIWAYLQPDGSWGWSNAGLVTDSGQSLLIDTLFDLPLTQRMLDSMRRVSPAAESIDTLVNTHANGDHCYGNQLVEGARIIASKASAEEMDAFTPAMMALFVSNAPQEGGVRDYVQRIFGDFEFEGIEHTPPTETFEQQLEIEVGNKRVNLIEVGPAHTRGDVLVHIPDDGVIFTGDILFIEGTPIMWEGPVDSWIRACDHIESLGAQSIVPGHGPLTNAEGVRAVRDYLAFVRNEAQIRFDSGMSAANAARDIDLGAYADWSDSERIAINVATLYRHFGAKTVPDSPLELFSLMAELARR